MIKRRDFCTSITVAPLTSAFASTTRETSLAAADAPAPASTDSGFPVSDYTPFGYLDNPWHTWNLHRSGILRSLPGIGFGFYFPAGPGGYFDFQHNEIYEAHLALQFRIGSREFKTSADFAEGMLTTPYHSKNILAYQFEAEGVRVISSFVLVNEDALGVQVQLSERGGRNQSVRILATLTYRLGAAKWWGRDGLTGEFDQADDALWIRSFAAGTVFAISGSEHSVAQFFSAQDADGEAWLNSPSRNAEKTSYYPQPLHGGLRYHYELASHSNVAAAMIMARGANVSTAVSRARSSLAGVSGTIANKRAADARFWAAAPMLTGDWPSHWKHGWVYDFETLRMMVRQPIGVYKHAWDAMQIQAPRNVLAETSIDMWALSYGDPATAKEVFAGQFLNALAPNVPCMREDGIMNMVAADGSECGTSISWCFPFFCAASIFDRTHDMEWLRRLYPGLSALLRWTLANRVDSGGFLVGKCSWETGMDTSKRFLIRQPTGGELVEFLRLVELQAAAAHAGALLARFAKLLQDTQGINEWQRIHKTYALKTQAQWKDDWFHDFDTRNGQLVTVGRRDPSQASPVFCGIATEDQKQRMLTTLRQIYEQSVSQEQQSAGWDDALAWSSFVLPYLESVWAAGDMELASDAAATIADRIYNSMDRRSGNMDRDSPQHTHLGWPGISCEIWGARGAFGGEGYGWGAVMPAHIIRNLVGFRETDDANEILLCPNLPASLAGKGRRYGIRGLSYGPGQFALSYSFVDERRIVVEGKMSGALQVSSVRARDGRALQVGKSGTAWRFEAVNREPYLLRLSGG